MKVVVDTNVVIAAFLKKGISFKVIEFLLYAPEIKWIISKEIEREYVDVLHRKKFHFSKEVIRNWFDTFDQIKYEILVTKKILFPEDPKDEKFLECAVASRADNLITGDKDFNEDAQKLIEPTQIITVSNFKKKIMR